jgi:translation elongation factor EF-G
MLEHAGHDWDDAAVLAEKTTPVFFGSASNNFGVQLLLDGFLKHAPAPEKFGRVMGGTPKFRRNIRSSPASSSKSRRTWTRSIATASRSSAFAPANSSAT